MFTNYGSLERFNTATGAVQEALNIPTMMGIADQMPWSEMTIAGTKAYRVTLVGTRNGTSNLSYVIGIGLASRHLLWKANLALSNWIALLRNSQSF